MQEFVKFVIGIIENIFQGFVLQKLWFWFIVSTFGLTALSLPVAIGIIIIVSLVTNRFTASEIVAIMDNKKDKEKTLLINWTLIFMNFILPLCSLILGYIVKLFM